MFPKEILMIYLEKMDLLRSRNIPNLKEGITGQKCQSLFRNFMKVAQWLLVSGEVKYVENAKALEMKEDILIPANIVMEQAKCFELWQWKIKQNKFKWSVISAKAQESLKNSYVPYVKVKKFKWSLEIWIFRLIKVWWMEIK